MKIVVNASNVAAFMGKHPYVTKREGILAAWKSSDRDSYKTLFERNHLMTPEDQKNKIRQEKSDSIRLAIEAWKESPTTAMHWKRDAYREFSKSVEESKLISDMVKCDIGTEQEHVILDRVNSVLGLSFKPKYDKLKRTFERDGHQVVVQGYLDAEGVDDQGNLIILEIKTRMYRLFKKIREYERIQVETYAWLTQSPGLKAYLAEGYFRSKHSPPDVNVQRIEVRAVPEWEQEFWDSVDLLIRLIQASSTEQDIFVRCD